jgi:hypothetical protein
MEKFQDQVFDVKLLLKRILKKYDGRAWTGIIWLRIGTNYEIL